MIFEGLKFKTSNNVYYISSIIENNVTVSWGKSFITGRSGKTVYEKEDVIKYFKNKTWIPLNKQSKKLPSYLF